MGQLTQAGRVAELITPLGQDVLVMEKFDGFEALGELFEFRIDALSEQENVDFDQAIGHSCTIKLQAYQGKIRIFDGILIQAEWAEMVDGYYRYRLVLRPWFALLGYRADCRIFLDKNVKDIIQEVFTKAGFTDFQFKTTGDYDSIPYCVQYRETDLAFCSRLMEQYGIYYFFEHAEGKHTMVLADSAASLQANPQVPTLPYLPLSAHELDTDQRLGAWTSQRRFRTGKVQFNDYDYLQPNKKLLAPNEASASYANAKLEVYDYPGKYVDEDAGMKLSKFRLEAEQCYDHRRFVDGDAASLFPGSLVTVERLPIASDNREYNVVRCNHSYGVQKYRASSGAAPGEVYRGSYEFLPSDIPFRMLPLTPKPRIYGIQTAKVVGKQGEDSEEISTDENGHIWVQFFWDRDPQKTCPIRVAQCWSGPQWGEQFIPRLGMEVVVEFLEGDPDRPLVVGCVYNGNNKYPYSLPDNKTQSGLKSDSSKGHNGYNEFMFEDKKSSELIRMHAEKDHLVQINHDQTGYVSAASLNSPYPGGNQTWTVGNNRTWTIEQGNDYLEVKQGNLSIDVDMGNYSLDVKMGNISVKADLGSITIEAMQSITLKVGQSSITLNQTGITVQSMQTQIEGTIQTEVKGLMTTIDGDAMLQLTGGVIMIG